MDIKTTTALDSALREGYQGKAVELVSTYAHRSTLLKMRADIDQKLKLVSGPLYLGEAEATLLYPLVTALRDATRNQSIGRAEVARHAYQLSASYALIFDVSKISQSKDIANQITLNSLVLQPIVQRLVGKISTKDGDNNLRPMKDVASEAWNGISAMLSNVVYYPSNKAATQNYVTPLAALYRAMTTNLTADTIQTNAVGTWEMLLSNLRHGKGTPLDRQGRKTYMGIMTEVLMRLDMLIDAARDEIDKYPDYTQTALDDVGSKERSKAATTTTAFIDAYTAMYWFLLYLEAISQYDVVFPASDLMVQSQAWVLVIKTQSAKLKKAFVDIAQVAASYDIYTAIRLWEEVRRFYDPMLNHGLSAVSNMDAIWSDNVQKADKLLSAYAKDQVGSMFTSFKEYMSADYLLPQEQFKFAGDVANLFEYPIPDSDGVYTVPTGRQALLKLDSVGEMELGVIDRELLVPGLANSAGNVELALAYIKRSREILQLTEELDDIYHALIPSGLTWENPYALKGKVTDLTPASFDFHDPMQLCYEKYSVTPKNDGRATTIASIDWYFSDLLMKPFYRIPQLQNLSEKRSHESRILWPGIGQLPVGDIITAEYVAQPIPACYTASRNSNFVNNDFSAYLTLMSGHSGVTAASRDMFRKLAAILDRYEDTYARSILDALAATMFVYRKRKDGSWDRMDPTLPTIYGVPTSWMLEVNDVKLSAAGEEAVLKRSVRVVLDNDAVYQFVLHSKMPKPGEMMYFAYPYAKGVYLQVPLYKDIFQANEEAISKVMMISFTGSDNGVPGEFELSALCKTIKNLDRPKDVGKRFIATLGWAPYLINLPHILCSYQDEEDTLLSPDYRKFAMMSVRVRYDAVERAIFVGGFVENPVELLDVSDYDSAVAAPDPSPISRETLIPVPESQPDSKEPTRAEAEQTPPPSSMGSTPKDKNGAAKSEEELNRLGTITPAPMAGGTKEGIVQPGQKAEVEDPVHAKPVDPDTLAGGPDAGEQKQPTDSGSEDAQSVDKYWKKISASGEVEDVVKAKTCPEGYVPASEDEYRNFVLKAAKDASKEEV